MGRELTLLAMAALLCLLCAAVAAQTTTTISPPTRTRILLGTCKANKDCTGPPLKPGQVRLCCTNNKIIRLYRLAYLPGKVYLCHCLPRPTLTGNCWKGSQCASCDQSFVGRINGLAVCCANCQRRGLRISSRSCNCN